MRTPSSRDPATNRPQANPQTPRPRPNPNQTPSPADSAARLDQKRRTLASNISAYPGTLTYLDLIRKNKRDSVLLLLGMFLLTLVVAGVIAATIGAVVAHNAAYGPPTNAAETSLFQQLLPSIILGLVAGILVFSLGSLWSWFGGAKAVLASVGARELRKEDDPELFNVVDEVRLAAGLPMPKVYIIPETALNAFATGRDPQHAAVAITAGLRHKLTRDELQGVMAHEVAHIRHYDIRFSMLMATMVGLIVFACDAFLRMAFFSGRGARGPRGGGGKGGGAAVAIMMVVALILAAIAPILAHFIQMAYSRKREYLADAGAVELTRYPEGLAGALAKLASDTEPHIARANRGAAHMYIVNPLRKYRCTKGQRSSPFASHPPINDRIAKLLALTR